MLRGSQLSAVVSVLSLSTLTLNALGLQNHQTSILTSFKEFLAVGDLPVCAVVATKPYRSYFANSISCCTYDCRSLKRQTSNNMVCVGFNFYDSNNTCQLLVAHDIWFFTPQPSCRHFMNVDVTGPKPAYKICPYLFTYNSQFNSCIRIVTTALDYESASLYCQHQKPYVGHLFFADNSQKAQPLYQMKTATDPVCGGYWIGLQSQGHGSPFYWKWNSGSVAASISYSNWAPEQPYGDGNCVTFVMSTLQWNDYECYLSLCFICEVFL